MAEDNQNEVKNWPFPERRYPHPQNPDYLGNKSLSRGVRKAINQELFGKQNLNVLAVGCGHKPFYPFFQPYAKEYVGTDIIKDNPLIDIVCPAENLLIQDEWADVVTCLSVLEHVDDPIKVVQELYRVVRPHGVVFASTHGCFPWHPYPQDHWRWTQTGLPLLFTRHGSFKNVQIFSTHGTFSGMFFILSHFIHSTTVNRKGKAFAALGKLLVLLNNKLGEYIDSKYPQMADVDRHVTAIPEFFIIARKA